MNHEHHSRRIGNFSERYEQWMSKVTAFRQDNPGAWDEPPDNS